jgi:hypothetical protein
MSGPAHIFGGSGFRRNRAIVAISGSKMLISGTADHVLHLGNHLLCLQWLAKKPAVSGDIDTCRPQLP